MLSELISDPSQFSSYLRYLTADQQQELLFICEVNQLLDKSKDLDEISIFNQAIKIAHIFLRTDGMDGLQQLQSIQPATRRHLHSCIPLTLPPHLISSPPNPITSQLASPLNYPAIYQPRYDTQVILTMMEAARDQVEEALCNKTMQKYIEFITNTYEKENTTISSLIPPSISSPSSSSSSSLSEIDFDQVVMDPVVFRSFLLFLMESKSHSILSFWVQLHWGQYHTLSLLTHSFIFCLFVLFSMNNDLLPVDVVDYDASIS